ncbi:MAG: hypothetical protein ABJG41_14020 [Cyclobacteriaceae bacterium]
MSIKVDIVYTWVNNDLQFAERLNTYATSNLDKKSNRYRDIHDTLKYSLRSVEKYAPWINKIHIVTQRPQVPEWLDQNHPKIKIVHHDAFIPEEYLPTFNPRVIQSFFHLIPNSADHLLYMNDDYLFGNKIEMDDYVTGKGKLKVYGSIIGIPLKFRVFAQKNQVIGLPRLEHFPFLIYKPYWENMLHLRESELEDTRRSRFRKRSNLRVDRLYRYYLLSKMRPWVVAVFAWRLLKISRFVPLTDDLGVVYKVRRALEDKPKFICINDNQSEQPNEAISQGLAEVLDQYYPDESGFEKNTLQV